MHQLNLVNDKHRLDTHTYRSQTPFKEPSLSLPRYDPESPTQTPTKPSSRLGRGALFWWLLFCQKGCRSNQPTEGPEESCMTKSSSILRTLPLTLFPEGSFSSSSTISCRICRRVFLHEAWLGIQCIPAQQTRSSTWERTPVPDALFLMGLSTLGIKQSFPPK